MHIDGNRKQNNGRGSSGGARRNSNSGYIIRNGFAYVLNARNVSGRVNDERFAAFGGLLEGATGAMEVPPPDIPGRMQHQEFMRGIFMADYESRREVRRRKCRNCKCSTHSLKNCLYAIECYITSCILCDTEGHAIYQCRQFEAMNLKDRIHVLIHDRAKRPALKTSIAWWKYLRDYAEAGGNEMPKEFPWSAEFAMGKAKRDDGLFILGLQTRWDEKRNMGDLPTDPKHASAEDVVPLYIGTYFLPTEASEA
ncbi:hypothetical protein EDB82DRAFT_479522 [Fusarium venenatum]|uniref:uncharacterized protein n=1 Tax=Fusarium venenatum TaxID=56646 RepID=UPI001D444823|nr:hypothetical protein EDB82DRAFT_479522 [Fusarium venenatum]